MADNLLDKASILLTPTAYNDGSMLSVKPENGDGDFTFSRGSAATRVNEQGLVENVQTISDELVSNGNFSQEGSELVTNGDFATDSDWTLTSGWSISNGKLIANNATSIAYQGISAQPNKSYKVTYTISDYTSGNVKFQFLGGSNSGTLRTAVGTYTEYIKLDASANGNFAFSRTQNFIGSIDNVSVKEVAQDWTLIGVDFSLGSVFFNAITDTVLQTKSFTVGSKYRITFSGSGDLSYRTGFAGADSTKKSITLPHTVDIVATSDTNRIQPYGAIDGSQGTLTSASVKEITDDTDLPRIDYTDGCGNWLLEGQSTNLYLNSETLLTQSNATSASTYTVSFYGTGTITFSGTHTGTLVGTGVNDRVSVTFTATSGTLTSTISGTCTKGQLENLSYATSYIPTNGAIATRLADVATNSGNASLINSTEGVLYVECAALENGSSIKIIELNDGTSSNRVFVYLRNDRLTYEVKSNGITSAGGTYDNLGVLNFHKIAVKWKDNDFALWLDGSKVLSDTSGSSPLALDRINFTDPFGGIPFYGKCKALAVYKEVLTDAELQSLTTI